MVPARACLRRLVLILRSCSLRRSNSSLRCRAVTPATGQRRILIVAGRTNNRFEELHLQSQLVEALRLCLLPATRRAAAAACLRRLPQASAICVLVLPCRTLACSHRLNRRHHMSFTFNTLSPRAHCLHACHHLNSQSTWTRPSMGSPIPADTAQPPSASLSSANCAVS